MVIKIIMINMIFEISKSSLFMENFKPKSLFARRFPFRQKKFGKKKIHTGSGLGTSFYRAI